MTELPPQGFRHAVTLLITNTRRRMAASGLDFTDDSARALAEEIVALASDMKAPSGVVEWVVDEYRRQTGSSADVRSILSRIGTLVLDEHPRDLFLIYVPEDRLPIAAPLAVELAKRGVSVGFSEYEVATADQIGRALALGLTKHRAGVLLRTPAFQRNHPNANIQDARVMVLDDVVRPHEVADRVAHWLRTRQSSRQV
jgi:hypothetical protein